jgi:hypothetical protein
MRSGETSIIVGFLLSDSFLRCGAGLVYSGFSTTRGIGIGIGIGQRSHAATKVVTLKLFALAAALSHL